MKGVIVYESKYGATEQYARWLGEELKLPVLTPGELLEDQINNADFLLLGTPVYFGKLRMQHWLKTNTRKLNNKKLFFFIVNASAPGEQLKRDKLVNDNIPAELKENAIIQFLPGRLIHKKLSFFDRLMVRFAESNIKDPEKRKAIRSDIDGVKKDNLMPVISAIRKYSSDKSTILSAKVNLSISPAGS